MVNATSLFLKDFEEASQRRPRSVTTSIEGEALALVRKWAGGRSVKATVAWLITAGNARLEEEQQARKAVNDPRASESPGELDA